MQSVLSLRRKDNRITNLIISLKHRDYKCHAHLSSLIARCQDFYGKRKHRFPKIAQDKTATKAVPVILSVIVVIMCTVVVVMASRTSPTWTRARHPPMTDDATGQVDFTSTGQFLLIERNCSCVYKACTRLSDSVLGLLGQSLSRHGNVLSQQEAHCFSFPARMRRSAILHTPHQAPHFL